ncbi:MAG: pirin family protein [Pyrinomonadaceae bacterium]|nr:pirin family protein [Pyrinomonadaceae bacterium]
MTKTQTKVNVKTVERVILPPPVHMVGDGFRVHGFFPSSVLSARRMSPFYLLDYNSKFVFPPSRNLLGVGPHPHRGFETVTIAYHGKIAHHDSRGNAGVIGEGDVQWMTAGSGILHKEYHEEEFNRKGGLFQMVQLWVNLPAKDKMTEPRYQALTNSEMGRVELPDGDGSVEIIAGDFRGVKCPAKTFSPINLFNLRLKKGKTVEIDLPENFTTAMVNIEGSSLINGTEKVPEDNFVLFNNDGRRFILEALDDLTSLVLSGEPLDEPVSAYGPFVMNTPDEIRQAIEDFQNGKFGELEG